MMQISKIAPNRQPHPFFKEFLICYTNKMEYLLLFYRNQFEFRFVGVNLNYSALKSYNMRDLRTKKSGVTGLVKRI